MTKNLCLLSIYTVYCVCAYLYRQNKLPGDLPRPSGRLLLNKVAILHFYFIRYLNLFKNMFGDFLTFSSLA